MKKSSEQKGNGDDKSNSVEAEELATNDKDEKSEYDEEADDVESNIDQMSEHMTTSMTVDDDGPVAKSNGKIPESSAKLDLPNSDLPEVCCVGCLFLLIHLDLYLSWFMDLF